MQVQRCAINSMAYPLFKVDSSMEDFKNIAKVIVILLAGMVWFYYQFHLNVTDDAIKSHVLERECPKVYDFRIVSCREYRGYNFVGVNQKSDTISVCIDYRWELSTKYHRGDRIVKQKGAKLMYLIKSNGDSLIIHLDGGKGEWL